MKKIFIFPIVILLLLNFFSFPTVAANAGTTMAEDIAVFQGRAATVAIFLSGCDYVKTGSITFELDNGLSIQSASWELDSALMKKYSASTEKGVFTFEKDTAVSGEIFTLTVEATENATIGVHGIFYSLQFRNSTGDSFSVCSSIKVTVLCAHNSIENILGKPATCIEDGMKSYWHCPDCGKNFSDSACQLEIIENLDAWRVIEKLGHCFTNYVGDGNATCTEDGTKTAHCDHVGCDETNTIRDANSAGHDYEWIVDEVATQAATGLKHEECTRCHAKRNENTVIPKFISEGKCGANGDNLSWMLDENGLLTITGTGTMMDWASDTSTPWYSYKSLIKSVSISQGVTNIGEYAFEHCEQITSVSIPNSVSSIGRDAFNGCKGLKEITIPNSVTTIGWGVFYGCSGLTAVTISEGLTTISNGLFSGCEKLTSITIPSSIVFIDNYAFLGCSSLVNITIKATTPPRLERSAIDTTSLAAIYVPQGCAEAYKTAPVWKEYASIISQDHIHVYSEIVTEPTCTEAGYTTYQCACGDKYVDSYVAALGHEYLTATYKWNDDQCTAKRVCSHDGTHIETETVTGIYVKDTNATCEANEKGHYEATFTNPAFAKQSTAKNSVEVAGTKIGHSFTTYVSDNNATCTADGTKTAHCDHAGCDATDTIADVGSKLGHNYDKPTYKWNGDKCTATMVCLNDSEHAETETATAKYVKDTDATCTENEKGHYEATFQNGAFAKQSTAKDSVEKPNSLLGHNFEWVIDQNATKTATGLKHEECTRCHATRNENTVIPILTCEHENAQKVNGKDATCTENGLKEYWHCPDCEKNFADSACKNEITGDLDTWRVIDKLGHSFTTYISDNNATCTADGTKTAHCDHVGCNETDTVVDPGSKLGHAYGTPTYVWNGDQCTAKRVCSHDGSHIETETVTGKYVKDTDAACEANEKGHYEASFQNGAFTKQSTAKDSVEKPNSSLGHNFEWVIDQNATKTATGLKHEECTRCHATRNENTVIPILTCEHENAQKVTGKAATCTENGLKEYWHCPDCGKDFSGSDCQLEIIGNLDAWRVITKLGHSFTTYVSDNNATCTEDGTKTAHCDHAGCQETDTIADPGSKLGHDYGTPTYVWNGNQCIATRVCSHDDSHTETETVTGIYVKDTDATCEENEKGHYEATFTNPAFAKQSTAKNSVEVPETKIGHCFTNYVSDNNATCTADGTKTAHCDHAGCDATDTIADVGSKLGHNYEKPTYTWNGDKCTATMVCLNDSSHPVIETATAVYVKDTNATCTENEKGHYEVTFKNGTFEQQFTEKNSVEKQGTKLGHNYVAVVTPPTETERGYTTHTCSHCHDSYVDSYTDSIPAVTYGDINGDGAIDAFDYQMLKAFVLGTFKDVTDEQKEAMDVNHDGCADAFDYQMLKAHVLGTYVIQ